MRQTSPSELAALKTLYLIVRSLDSKGASQTKWDMRWKPARNAFTAAFADRMPTTNNH